MKAKYSDTETYVNMPYKKIVYSTGEKGDNAYFAEVIEFNGCYAEGATREGALNNLDDSIRAYIEASILSGSVIPAPMSSIKNSGKILVRMSPNLHNNLIIKAKQSDMSLNTTIVNSIIAGMQQI